MDFDALHRAGEALRDGGLVAFPTETVYGLGARADDAAAVTRLREVQAKMQALPTVLAPIVSLRKEELA